MTNMKSRRPEPAEIEYKNMRFLIMDRPTDSTMDKFIEELHKKGAKDVVRVCEPTYKTEKLDAQGIRVIDCQFDDGNPPPGEVIEEWINLLKTRFKEEPGCCVAVHCVAGLGRFKEEPGCCVAVHCVAGLGRAPVLVALALIECGMLYEDAVELIRQKRRGAINAKQLAFLEHYRPKSRLKQKGNGHKQCCVM